nr:phospholipase-like protein [Tanacetum cinerariifolium]
MAASRYKRRKIGTYGNPDEYPSLVSDFSINHTSKVTGTYMNEAASTKHKELQDSLKSSQESGVNVPEKEVVKRLLGTRSGHTRGVGRKLKGVSSSSSVTSSSSNYYGGSKTYTQDEVNDLFKTEGHSLRFGRREFSLITGFRFGTVNFDLHPSSDLKFRNRVFPNKIGYIITNLDIIGVIEDEERFGKLSDNDAIRLRLLLAVEVIFMGWLLTFNVDDTLFRLVENL